MTDFGTKRYFFFGQIVKKTKGNRLRKFSIFNKIRKSHINSRFDFLWARCWAISESEKNLFKMLNGLELPDDFISLIGDSNKMASNTKK